MHIVNKSIISLLCAWWFCLTNFSQNINLDDNCGHKNTLLLYNALVNAKEDTLINDLIEKNSKLLLMINTDSLGRFISIKKIRTNLKTDEQKLDKCLKQALIRGESIFFICYSIPYKQSEKQEMLNRLKDGLRVDKKNEYVITIGFPGSLMVLYEYEKSKNKNLTRIEYLKRQLKKIKNSN